MQRATVASFIVLFAIGCTPQSREGDFGRKTSTITPPVQPQNSTCGGLDQLSCDADILCRSVFEPGSCAQVMPVDGGPMPECPNIFSHCTLNLPPQDPCAGMPEALCAAPFCRPVYGASLPIACDEDGGCANVPGPAYLGCEGSVSSCFSNCDCAVNEYCHVGSVLPDPTPVTADGGVARCIAAPTGICRRVPGI